MACDLLRRHLAGLSKILARVYDNLREAGRRVSYPLCETIPAVTSLAKDSPFLRACRREPVPYTPVWFMRQAGRSLPEYRQARAGLPMLESCTRADLITEITLQPLRRYDVDAAILFSDIVVPLKAVGFGNRHQARGGAGHR